MKQLEFMPRAKSAKEFFDFYHDSKFLIFDRSRVKEINLLSVISILSGERIDGFEYCMYRAEHDVFQTYRDSAINSAFKDSIGVVGLDNYLDDFELFEDEKALDRYVDEFRSSYLKGSIAFDVTGEMIDDFLEQDRQNRIRSLKEGIKDYQKSIDRMTKELEELEKI